MRLIDLLQRVSNRTIDVGTRFKIEGISNVFVISLDADTDLSIRREQDDSYADLCMWSSFLNREITILANKIEHTFSSELGYGFNCCQRDRINILTQKVNEDTKRFSKKINEIIDAVNELKK